jgi:hypothetical protein
LIVFGFHILEGGFCIAFLAFKVVVGHLGIAQAQIEMAIGVAEFCDFLL